MLASYNSPELNSRSFVFQRCSEAACEDAQDILSGAVRAYVLKHIAEKTKDLKPLIPIEMLASYNSPELNSRSFVFQRFSEAACENAQDILSGAVRAYVLKHIAEKTKDFKPFIPIEMLASYNSPELNSRSFVFQRCSEAACEDAQDILSGAVRAYVLKHIAEKLRTLSHLFL